MDANGVADLRGVLARVQSDFERQRTDIARRLHGDLGGSLTVVRLSLDALGREHSIPAEMMAALSAQLDAAMRVKQELVESLRPSLLDHFGVGIALSTRFEAGCRAGAVPFGADVDPRLPSLAPGQAILLYRLGEAILRSLLGTSVRSMRLVLEAVPGGVALVVDHEGGVVDGSVEPEMLPLRCWLDHVGGRMEAASGAVAARVAVMLPTAVA